MRWTHRAVLPYLFDLFFALLLSLLFFAPEFRMPFGYLFGVALTERMTRSTSICGVGPQTAARIHVVDASST